MANVYNSIKDLLEKMEIDNFDLKKPGIDHLFGTSMRKNKEFFKKKIGEIYKESKPPKSYDKKKKISYMTEISKKIDEFLNDKTDNPEIKALKAIFNKQYYDFLKAFLADKENIIIKNDNNDEKEPKSFSMRILRNLQKVTSTMLLS